MSASTLALVQSPDRIHWYHPARIQNVLDRLNLEEELRARQQTILKVQTLSRRLRSSAELGNWTEMSAYATRLIEMMPTLPTESLAESLIDRAVARTMLRESNGAIADTTQVIEMPPSPSETARAVAFWVRAQARELQRRWMEATRDYSSFIERCATSDTLLLARARLYRGIAYEKTGDREKALQDLRSVDFPLAASHLHHLFIDEMKRKIAEAVQILCRGGAPLEQGNKAFDKQRYVEAIALYSHAIDSKCALRSEQPFDEDDIPRVSELGPRDRHIVQVALLNRGSAKMALSLWAAAFDDLTLFLRIDSLTETTDKIHLKHVLVQRVRASMQLERWGKVIEDISHLLELQLPLQGAELAQCHFDCGRAYEKLDFWPNAFSEYTEAHESCPENRPALRARILLYRGIASKKLGKMAEALQDLKRVDFHLAKILVPPLSQEEVGAKIAEAEHILSENAQTSGTESPAPTAPSLKRKRSASEDDDSP